MADFNISREFTKTNEGGYNRATFGSGETYKGIDRLKGGPAAKNWQGWKIIDAWKSKYGIPKEESTLPIPELDILVNKFYKDNVWNKSGTQFINNQQLANFYYDFYFHKPAIAVAAMNDICKQLNPNIIVNSNTVSTAVVNIVNALPGVVYSSLYKLRVLHYNNKYLNDRFRIKYKSAQKGLLARVAKFPSTLT